MDYLLIFLIPTSEFEKLNMEEILVEWGDEVFSQTPPKFRFNSHIILYEVFDKKYFENKIQGNWKVTDYRVLAVEGNNLGELSIKVNNNKPIDDDGLIIFLDKLCNSVNGYCILKPRDEEYFDKTYFLSKPSDIKDEFIKSLLWDKREGIIVVKNKEVEKVS